MPCPQKNEEIFLAQFVQACPFHTVRISPLSIHISEKKAAPAPPRDEGRKGFRGTTKLHAKRAAFFGFNAACTPRSSREARGWRAACHAKGVSALHPLSEKHADVRRLSGQRRFPISVFHYKAKARLVKQNALLLSAQGTKSVPAPQPAKSTTPPAPQTAAQMPAGPHSADAPCAAAQTNAGVFRPQIFRSARPRGSSFQLAAPHGFGALRTNVPAIHRIFKHGRALRHAFDTYTLHEQYTPCTGRRQAYPLRRRNAPVNASSRPSPRLKAPSACMPLRPSPWRHSRPGYARKNTPSAAPGRLALRGRFSIK